MPASLRSLADDLRQRSDSEIAELLTVRPDLIDPIPTSISELARLANSTESVAPALGTLTATDLTVLEACCALAPDHQLTVASLSAGLACEPEPVSESLRNLWQLALLWGPDEDLRVPASVRQIMGPYPCGLDQVVRSPVAVAGLESIAAMQKPAAFDAAPAQTQELLEELTWRVPVITSLGAAPESTSEWLSMKGILKLVGESSFALPRETSLALRNGHLLPTALPTQPTMDGKTWPEPLVESTAAHSADLFLRTVDRIVESTRLNPPALLSRGGMAVRDCRNRADELRIPVTQLVLALEVGQQAGWLAASETGTLVPTVRHLETADNPRAQRWTELAIAWLQMPRKPWQTAVESMDRNSVPPLTPDLADDQILTLKAHAIEALIHAGTSVPAAALMPWLVWRTPRTDLSPQVVAELLHQAETLGMTGLGAISEAGALVADKSASKSRIAALLTPRLPSLSDRFVLQADLTATATSPLAASTERRLCRVAEFESGGGATVYRFTHNSVGRGLAHGERAEDLTRWLLDSSDTGLPKSISVIIADVARSQGEVRITPASAALQGNAETIDQIMGDPGFASLGLSRLSEDVVCAQVGPEELLARLRSAGIAAHSLTQDPKPANAQPERPSLVDQQSHAEGLRKRVIAALRQVEQGPNDLADPIPTASSASEAGFSNVSEILVSAADNNSRLLLEFSDESGSLESHLVDPIRVSGGKATFFDRTTNTIRSIPLSRMLRAIQYPSDN